MTSIAQDASSYCEVCSLASQNDDYFRNFKRHPSYTPILEHVSEELGYRYYETIFSEHIKNNALDAKINDSLGNPVIYKYPFGEFSPTTLRYLKVLSDLSMHDLNHFKIAEIGAGYGGQYVVMRQFFKPLSYDFFDLNEVESLIDKYISTLGLNDIDISYSGHSGHKRPVYDLVISNFAISECDIFTQDHYIENVIKRAKHGYITYNHMRGYSVGEFINKLTDQGKSCVVTDEIPDSRPTGHTWPSTVVIRW